MWERRKLVAEEFDTQRKKCNLFIHVIIALIIPHRCNKLLFKVMWRSGGGGETPVGLYHDASMGLSPMFFKLSAMPPLRSICSMDCLQAFLCGMLANARYASDELSLVAIVPGTAASNVIWVGELNARDTICSAYIDHMCWICTGKEWWFLLLSISTVWFGACD